MINFKIYAVDFDGTLCENKWPNIGMMNIQLIYYLIDCQKKGDKIILWTCRVGDRLREAIEACRQHGLEFDAVNRNLPEIIIEFGVDPRKIYADEYIDDRSCHDFKLPFVGGTTSNIGVVDFVSNIGVVNFVENVLDITLFPYQKALLTNFETLQKKGKMNHDKV